MAIGTVRINLEASTAKFEKSVQSFNKKLDRTFNTISTKAKQVGLALTGIGAGLAYMTKKSIDAADQISKVAQKIGTTTEELSKLRYAAELTGVSQNTLDMAMQRFTRRLAEAAQGTGEAKGALQELNINASKLLDLPLEQRMQVLADRFKAIENPADRVRIAMKLFDSEGVSLVNTLSNGSAELNKMTSEAQRLGLVIDTKTAKSSEAFNDNLTRLSSIATGFSQKLSAELLPSLNVFSDELVKLSQNKDFLKGVSDSIIGLKNGLISTVSFILRLKNALKIMFEQVSTFVDNSFLYSKAIILQAELEFKRFARTIREELVDALGFNVAKNLGIDTDFTKQTKDILNLETSISKIGNQVSFNNNKFEDFKIGILESNDYILDMEKNFKKVGNAISQNVSNKNINIDAVLNSDEIDSLPDKLSKMVQFGDIKNYIDPIKSKMKDFYSDITDYGTQFADSMQGAIMGVEDAFVNFAKTGKLSFSDLANSIISDLARIAVRQTVTAPLTNFLGSIDFSSLFGGSGYTSYTDGWLSGMRANGGQVSANSSYLVGERGPEIFTPSSSGAIIPNNKLVGGSNGNKTIINIENNTGSQIDDTNITEMLRKNSQGEEERVISIVLNRLNTDSGFRSAFGR